VIEWVHAVNTSIERLRIPDALNIGRNEISHPIDAVGYEEFCSIFHGLDSYDKLDVQETLVRALAEIQATYLIIGLVAVNRMVKMAGGTRVCRHFNHPLNLGTHGSDQSTYLTSLDLYEESKKYHERTNRPIREAADTIAKHIKDLRQRYETIEADEDMRISEENAPRPLNTIDSRLKINKKQRILSGIELRHENQLLMVFKSEGIEVYYLEKLPFLSLLVEYETEDGQRHHAAVIRAGLHQALKEFLLAHEMGHWFLQVNPDSRVRYEQVDRFLRSPAQHKLLENEADNFGMSVLFPPNYLADWAIFHEEVSADDLLNEFVSGMESVSDRLRKEMRRYIDEYVDKHKRIQKAEKPGFLTLEVESIEEEALEGLLILIQKAKDTVYWVRLSKDSTIMDAGEKSEELFGIEREYHRLNAHRPSCTRRNRADAASGRIQEEAHESDLLLHRGHKQENEHHPAGHSLFLSHPQ
jgi:Zn-dependent peptidase ImmA (M78 family)